MVQPLWKMVWHFLKKKTKLKIELPYDLAVLLLVYIWKQQKLT